MATLSGGARRHVFVNADGRRHDGPDAAGSVSFLPAGCKRTLDLHDVAWRWAAISLAPSQGLGRALGEIGSITLAHEPFVFGLLREMERIDAHDDGLEPIYAETMSMALTQYIAGRYGQLPARRPAQALPDYKLRRVGEFVAANLARRISLRRLAQLCDLSERHFHRAFRLSLGMTPLGYVVSQRVAHAKFLLARDAPSVAAVALAVGFSNPSHFSREFTKLVGVKPSIYRRDMSSR